MDELLGRIKIQESILEDEISRIKRVEPEVNRHRVTSQSDQAVGEVSLGYYQIAPIGVLHLAYVCPWS